MKYVILKTEHDGMERAWPIIFPTMLVHADVFARIQMQIFRDANAEPKLHSAGAYTPGLNACVRGSETLNVPQEFERNQEDERLIFLNDSTAGIIF